MSTFRVSQESGCLERQGETHASRQSHRATTACGLEYEFSCRRVTVQSSSADRVELEVISADGRDDVGLVIGEVKYPFRFEPKLSVIGGDAEQVIDALMKGSSSGRFEAGQCSPHRRTGNARKANGSPHRPLGFTSVRSLRLALRVRSGHSVTLLRAPDIERRLA